MQQKRRKGYPVPNHHKESWSFKPPTHEEKKRSPEADLLVAVLQRAILDATGNLSGSQPGNGEEWGESERQHIILEARRWFCLTPHTEDSIQTTPFSFHWICEQLDIPAEIVQEHVRHLIQQNLEGRAVRIVTNSSRLKGVIIH